MNVSLIFAEHEMLQLRCNNLVKSIVLTEKIVTTVDMHKSGVSRAGAAGLN